MSSKARDSKKFFIMMVALAFATIVIAGQIAIAEEVKLQWEPSSTEGLDGYRVYQRPNNGEYKEPVAETAKDVTTARVTGLQAGSTHHWVVRAFKGDAESLNSNEATHFVPIEPPPDLKIIVIGEKVIVLQ